MARNIKVVDGKVKTSVRLPEEVYWEFQKAVAARRMPSDEAAYVEAIEAWCGAYEATRKTESKRATELEGNVLMGESLTESTGKPSGSIPNTKPVPIKYPASVGEQGWENDYLNAILASTHAVAKEAISKNLIAFRELATGEATNELQGSADPRSKRLSDAQVADLHGQIADARRLNELAEKDRDEYPARKGGRRPPKTGTGGGT